MLRCNTFIRDTFDYCGVTLKQYQCQVIKLFSFGPIYDIIKDTNTNLRILIDCISEELFMVRQFICQMAIEANPCTATCPITLAEWAAIYGIDQCPDIEITPELICNFYKNSGAFTCEWITYLAEVEGYTVINCEEDCTLGPQLEQQCGSGFGTFPVLPCTEIEQLNTECERKYSQYPCLNCCPDSVSATTTINSTGCNVVTQSGGCAVCNDKCQQTAQFQFLGTGAMRQEACNPSTLTITLAGKSPCVQPAAFDRNFGRPFGDANPATQNFRLCLLESQLPSHIKINYEFEHEC